jgi:hypothetical protein
MPTTINLGTGSNGETDIPDNGQVNFANTTSVSITLTTPQGINPAGTTDIAASATSRNFTVSGNKNAVLDYSWDDTGSMKRATRGGTIKVT